VKKAILLTGATGYLGGHLANTLVKRGYDLIILKRKNSSLSRIKSIIPVVVMYDIENLDFSVPFKANGKIDAVIHTATCYGRHEETTVEIFEANTGFPLKLVDAASAAGVSVFINTDTSLDKYLNQYALSKNQLLEWGKFFSLHNKIRFINIRLEHFYGFGDDDSKFTAHVIKSCLENIPELKLTRGEQKRDFIYIDDVVSAYLIILEKIVRSPNFFHEFEVGSGAAVSIMEFVKKVHYMTGSRTHLDFGSLPYREGEVMSSYANVELLSELGWRCKTTLEEGLNLVIQAHKK